MTYSDALKRGDTQGQHRAHERDKRATHGALADHLQAKGIISGKKKMRLKRAMRLA